MSKIRESILQGIHAGTIKPHSRGYYLVLHAFLWIACITTLILGVLSVALIFFEMNSPEHLSMEWMLDRDLLWLRALPLLWSVGAIIALILWYILFSRTDRGYRVSPFMILLILCVGSLVGGGLLYISGIIHFGDTQIRRLEPRYDNFRNRFQQVLPRPEEGQLLLRIQQHIDNTWTWKSLDWRIWQVILKCSSPECEQRAMQIKFKWPPTLFVWEMTDKNIFSASDVRLPPRNPMERQKIREEFWRRNVSGEMSRMQKR